MWQTLRFTLGVLGHITAPVASLEETTPLSSMDRWICSRLYSTVLQCEQAFEAYELHTVTSALYSFWVHSLCDVYMEHEAVWPRMRGNCQPTQREVTA
ncbi:unnamed protein product [Pleuronectes platessa]|uniref:valine--tRNA ligase n=1 Tax=Pleuronectes platessa TaxID=8262 RepID=A0A9N7VAT2_PLEPL|nr:unnamed protein product [Pleuronectes platessa]